MNTQTQITSNQCATICAVKMTLKSLKSQGKRYAADLYLSNPNPVTWVNYDAFQFAAFCNDTIDRNKRTLKDLIAEQKLWWAII